ncbi:hypothetical protein [Pseudokineococcus sp. 1T1Z-3]|uniref:hypothetical protein n=1 Tax=Pseudokineococcus sp. 1T1Z-3 TaxID=3132745 RepID=UPI0030AAC045
MPTPSRPASTSRLPGAAAGLGLAVLLLAVLLAGLRAGPAVASPAATAPASGVVTSAVTTPAGEPSTAATTPAPAPQQPTLQARDDTGTGVVLPIIAGSAIGLLVLGGLFASAVTRRQREERRL